MQNPIRPAMYALMWIVGSLAATGFAQEPNAPRFVNVPPARAEQAPKFSFILFWKENDPNTQRLAAVLKASVTKRAERAEWTDVNVNDSTKRDVVERYQVSRMPMPTVLCVAPNGAITGAFVRKLSDEAVEGAIVSPAAADIVKALQDKKIVVVHVKQDARSPLPVAAAELMADPAFQARTTTVAFVASDPGESRLLTDMEINAADVNGSLAVVLAPPGVVVGKFAATATKDQIAAALHAAGKCCNDANCKHNQQGQQP